MRLFRSVDLHRSRLYILGSRCFGRIFVNVSVAERNGSKDELENKAGYMAVKVNSSEMARVNL